MVGGKGRGAVVTQTSAPEVSIHIDFFSFLKKTQNKKKNKKVHCVDVCLPHVYIYIFTHIHPHAHTRRLVKISVTLIFPNSFFFFFFF